MKRLLNADHAALVLAFLGAVFVDENVRSIAAVELAGRSEDEHHADEVHPATGCGSDVCAPVHG